jgi:hypothetical protein
MKGRGFLLFLYSFYSFGVERRKSAAASPIKQIERNPIFELEYASKYY